MTRLIPILLLAAGAAQAGYVQSQVCYGATSTTCSFAATPAAGHTIYVIAGASSAGSWSSAVALDNQVPSNTYTNVGATTSGMPTVVFAGTANVASGTFTITVNSTYTSVHVVIAEYSAASTVLDKISFSAMSGPYTSNPEFVPCGSVTTTNASDILLLGLIEGGFGGDNVTIAAQGTFTTRYPPATQNVNDLGLADQAVSATGTFSPTWAVSPNWNMNNQQTCVLAAFQQAAAPTMSVAPAAIPANHNGNITLTLTGASTTWSGSTVFTVSGVAGATKVSQAVTSASSATVVVTTGAGAGTLTVTESVTGTTVGTATVGTEALSVSPSSGPAGAAAAIALTGTNTVWTQETATTLFSLSGSPGSTFAGTPTVTSNTSATATINVGVTSGTTTITDSTTGVSTPFTGASPACTGYAYSATLTVAQVGANLSNFPVTVSLNLPGQNVLSSQGNDICISNVSNTVSYPIQWLSTVNAGNLSSAGYSMDGPVHEYNWATGKVNFVFQAPALGASGPTTFTLWTGNPFAVNPDSPMVWDTNTTLVAHLQEIIGGAGATGGTANAVTGTFNVSGNPNTTRAPGQIGFAQAMAGTLVFYGGGASCTGCSGETVEAMVKLTSGSTPTFDLANGGRFQGSGATPDVQIVNGQAWCYGPGSVQGPLVNDGNWHWLSCTSGPANNGLYVDGSLIGNPGENDGYNTTLNLAGAAGVNLEEVRVSSTARSAAWIAAEALNLLHPGNFVTLGAWSFAAGAGPAISSTSLAGNSPNSLKATWTTSTNGSSQVLCGTAAGGPYTYFTPVMHPVKSGNASWGVTNHSVAITGLPNNTSATAYYCVARSIDANGNWSTSTEMHAGTLAPVVSTPFKVSYVSPATRPNDQPDGLNGMPAASCWFDGDTQYSTWAADGNQYGMCEDCGGPQNGATASNPAILMLKWNDKNHLCGTQLAFGLPTSGGYPAGSAWDSIGGISVNGVIYHSVGRREGPFCCNSVLKTSDYWAHSLAPQHNTGPASAMVAGIDWPTPGNAMFQRATLLTAWVQYGQDYNSGAALPWYAGTDGWVYAMTTGSCCGADLTRTRIEDMPLQDPSKRQYYNGTQNGADGIADSAWSYDYTQSFNLEASNPQLIGSFSKFSMTFVPDFNRFALVLNPQIPASSFTAGTEIMDCQYPWSICTSIGTAPRSQSFLSHYPGFGQLLSATYTKLSSTPLESTMALSTASGYTYASNAQWDDYSTLMYTGVLLGPRGDASRLKTSSNSRWAHVAGGLDLDYEFGSNGTGNTGDVTMRNQSPNDPNGLYNTTVNVAADQFSAFYFDQYGMYNFGLSASGGRSGQWGSPQYYTLTTPYAQALNAFTAVVVWGHYPASVTANGTTYTLTIPSNETVVAKGTDLVIQRNGTNASSWNVIVGGTIVATGVPCTDGAFCAFMVRRDVANKVTVYRSNSIQGALPLTPDGSATVSGAWSANPLTFGSSLVGEISEGLVWNRALSDGELIQEMGVVRRNMAARGVTIQ